LLYTAEVFYKKTLNTGTVVMNLSLEVLTTLTFLIPGFLSSAILGALVVRREKDPLGRVVEALIFSLSYYVLVTAITRDSPVFLRVEGTGNEKIYSINFNPKFTILLVLIALIAPLMLSLFLNNSWHMRLLRFLRITERSSRDTVWLDVFTEQKRYITINLVDGRRVWGWPNYYSDNRDEGMIYLYDAAWIVDNEYQEVPGHGLFLVRKDQIDNIEFSSITERNARETTDARKQGSAAKRTTS